jgi:DNA polymerase-3 subunit delta'
MLLTRHLCPWLREPLAELENAAALERLGHGWIVAGPQGLGKVNLALVFADRLLRGTTSSSPPMLGPAELLAGMRARTEPADQHPDLHLVWPEEGKRTISVDQIRAVNEMVVLTAFQGHNKVVVIEPAESMTTAAANALLKSLEEPTPDTFLILVSHRPGRLPATIRSRCQSLVIRRPAADALQSWLGDDGTLARDAPDLAGGWTPLIAAQHLLEGNISKYSKLFDDIRLIYENRGDAQSCLDGWKELDLEIVLAWIADRIRAVIRVRLASHGTNSVTEHLRALPDNAWQRISTNSLFELLGEAESLRDRLGTGINEELAMQVLLNGFLGRQGT